MAPSLLAGNPKLVRLSCLLLLAVSGLSNCTQAQPERGQERLEQTASGMAQPAAAQDDSEVLDAQAKQLVKVQVTVTAPVLKMLPEDDRGLPHEKFLIQLSNGSTVLIAHDIKYAPVVPLRAGDTVRIHGEYIWNAKGGLIHWTHHSDTPRHESGWIDFNGQRYQ